jgi:hypothetical protein
MPEPTRTENAVVLAKLLFENGPLCALCISAQCGLAVRDIEPTAKRLEQTLTTTREMGHCKACEMRTLVYSLFCKSPK